MAVVDVNIQRTGKPNKANEITYSEVAAGDTVKLDAGFKDFAAVLIFKGGAADSSITVKAGNGYAGVNDYKFTLTKTKDFALVLDSARFENVVGADSGKILIESTAACSVALVEIGAKLQTEANA